MGKTILTPTQSQFLASIKRTSESGRQHHFDIAVEKVYNLSGQIKVRDFIDLYFILKKEEFSLEQTISRVPDKFGVTIDLTYFASQLLRVADLPKDFPTMLVPFDFDEMVEFYKKLAKRLGNKVLK